MGKLFTDSLQELKNLKSMVMAAMLLAIAVVLGFFTLQLTEFIILQMNLQECCLVQWLVH